MDDLFKFSLLLILSFAVIVFVLLFFVTAPYGKFLRKGWGPFIKTKWAWMIMEFPSPGLAFFIFTFANLFPRAISSHRWYKNQFPGYPNSRKAVIPFVI